jgi:hypothetical protein
MMIAYEKAAHRIPTAIAVLMGRDPDFLQVQPKHLRVGLDLSKSDVDGLARPVIARGVFTEAAFADAITAFVEQKADAYENMQQSALGDSDVRTR